MTVARTHMYTHDANVWDFCIVQGPLSVAPCQILASVTICNVFIAVHPAGVHSRKTCSRNQCVGTAGDGVHRAQADRRREGADAVE
jgi:hypothetical protein